MIKIKQNTLSFYTVFILTAGLFTFLIAIVTVDRNSAALIGENGVFSPSSPFFAVLKNIFNGILRFFRVLDNPCFELIRKALTYLAKGFLTLFSLPELIRSFFVELFHTI